MASLRDKLGKLGARAPAPAPDLTELRARLAGLVAAAQGTTPLPEPPRSAVTAAALGFEPVAGGPTGGWLRRRTFAPAHRAGQLELGAVLGADRHLLALLSLTPALDSCDPCRALYFDTETTGLGGAGTLAFLVGLCWYEPPEQAFVLEQWLLGEPAAEPWLLRGVRERLAGAELLVSYNGKSFDLPVVRSRLVLQRLEPVPVRPHLDLLHVARRVHRRRRWRKALPSVETHVLGLDRGPDVSGDEVAQRYFHFLRTGDLEAVAPVVAHNEHDVLALVALAGLYGEPFDRLAPDDVAELARTLGRAGDPALAEDAVARAIARGAGADGLRVRAELAKARGDRGQALADFETLATEIDDPGVRLELAKLYEHYVRAPLRALEQVARGTGETAAATALRQARLERKRQRAHSGSRR